MTDVKMSRFGSEFTQNLKLRDKARRGQRVAIAKAAGAATGKRNDLLPKLALVDRPPGDLKAPTRALRKLAPAHIREIAASIDALGFCAPVLISEDSAVID